MNHENFNVKVSDILYAVSALPRNTSPGIDGLVSEHFKLFLSITSYVKAWVISKAIHVDYDCSNIEE